MSSNAVNESISDSEIIDLVVKQGQSYHYSKLIDRYRGRIINKCYSLVKDRALAEECTNDILSKAFEKLSEFKGGSSFSTWLYSISYNHCIDYLRTKKKMHYPKWDLENSLPEIVDFEEEDLAELNYERLLTIMEMIHPEEKALLIMKYKDDLPLKQMAVALRISESALKMRLQRARARVVFLHKKHYKNN